METAVERQVIPQKGRVPIQFDDRGPRICRLESSKRSRKPRVVINMKALQEE